jgi:cytochrome c nitrite reductase small subunit
MKKPRKKSIIGMLLIIGLVAAAVIIFLLHGPPKLLAKSESPGFCAGCHVMESEFESWSHEGAHRRKLCVDCHLPNENAAIHYVWKSLDGLKDIAFFYSGRAPEHIRLTSHGAEVLQANCIRCHQTTVEYINHDRKCWECHRRIMHRRSGSIETI